MKKITLKSVKEIFSEKILEKQEMILLRGGTSTN